MARRLLVPLALAGDGAGARELLRRLPETAVDRGTYLLAMRAHKHDVDGCLALFRACEPATGEPVDEKLVAAATNEWVARAEWRCGHPSPGAHQQCGDE